MNMPFFFSLSEFVKNFVSNAELIATESSTGIRCSINELDLFISIYNNTIFYLNLSSHDGYITKYLYEEVFGYEPVPVEYIKKHSHSGYYPYGRWDIFHVYISNIEHLGSWKWLINGYITKESIKKKFATNGLLDLLKFSGDFAIKDFNIYTGQQREDGSYKFVWSTIDKYQLEFDEHLKSINNNYISKLSLHKELYNKEWFNVQYQAFRESQNNRF